MANQDEDNFDTARPSFRLSNRPLAATPELAGEELAELPRSYGEPIVVAIPRDPKSLFVYWDIDWSQTFAQAAPADRKVYLRLFGDDGSEVDRMAVEPFAQSCDVRVSQPRGSLRVDLGYFGHDQMWHSAGVSDLVSTPPEKIGTLTPGDFALVPFHITFQRLTELFRDATNGEGGLTRRLLQLQEKGLRADERDSLTAEEDEIFRAMKASVSEKVFAPHAELDSAEEMRLQKKLESVLGFGATSLKTPFGGSSGGL